MEEYADFTNFENCYVNIPIHILKMFWLSHGIDEFLYHVLAFGAASGQILSIERDNIETDDITIRATKAAIEPIIDSIADFLNEYHEMYNHKLSSFVQLALVYRDWIEDIGGEGWMRESRWIGVTAYNLKKMLNGRHSISTAKRERWEQMWMIYFGLKSVIGRKRYVQMSWDFILIRSMGFLNTKEYNDYFDGGESWITKLRNRKASEKMIGRLRENFNIVYATHRPQKGERPEVAQWSFQKDFKWVPIKQRKKGTP